MIVVYVIMFLCIRGLYLLSKDNSGKLRCKGLIGRLFHHRFVEHWGDRVCRICGLVQKRGPAGILMEEGDTWYDEGYAENKTELVTYYMDKIKKREEHNKLSKQRHKAEIINTKIKTPSIRKVKPKEDDSQ